MAGKVRQTGGLENVTEKNGLRSVTGITKQERITNEMVEKYFHAVELRAPSYTHIFQKNVSIYTDIWAFLLWFANIFFFFFYLRFELRQLECAVILRKNLLKLKILDLEQSVNMKTKQITSFVCNIYIVNMLKYVFMTYFGMKQLKCIY